MQRLTHRREIRSPLIQCFPNDYLSGTSLDDLIVGWAGNDSLYGGNGADTLDGGAGNDFLDGGKGDDVYLFGRGSGQDTISDLDSTVGTDKVQLAADMLPGDVTLVRQNNNLVLGIVGTTDTLTLQNWYSYYYSATDYRIEQLVFADGTVWDATRLADTASAPIGTEGNDVLYGNSQVNQMEGLGGDDTLYGGGSNDVLLGGDGADYLSGDDGDDLLSGGEGNDTLYGSVGNDMLLGGAGNDSVYSGNGADLLDGGAGNDFLDGGAGNDVYLFGRGSGQDVISDLDRTAGNLDSVQLAADVVPGDVTLVRQNNNLVLGIVGTTDTLTLQNWYSYYYSATDYRIEQLVFGDGTTFQLADLQFGTAGNDSLTGTSADSVLMGYDGDDSLSGGAGNDWLNGGAGNDTYLFGRGSALDSVSENDATAGNTDQALFASGIATDQLWFAHVGNNLEVSIIGTSDTLTVQDWYAGSETHVEQFRTADNQVLLDTQVENLVQAMAAFAPPAAGQTTLPPDYAESLAPVIAANWQ